MTAFLQRREILAGRLKDAPRVPRPLGAIFPEMAFRDACTRCGACAAACPADIIRRDRHGFPVIDVSAGECSFCASCAEACPTPALSGDRAWPWRAALAGPCLGQSGIACRACEDSCDEAALRFAPMTGGRSAPAIDPDRCTGCGACVPACPAGALALAPVSPAGTSPSARPAPVKEPVS